MSCDVATDTPASRSLDRLTTGPFLTATASCDAGKGRPFEGFCTNSVPRIQTNYPRAMRSPPIVSCITADQPMRFGGTSSPYRSCRDRLRCRAFCDLREVRCSWCPSEYSVWLLDRKCCHRGSSSCGIGCSFRVPDPPTYRPYWLGDSTLPLAVSSALWLFRRRASLVTFQSPVEPSLRVSPPSRVLPSHS
jgi:hypothetical protein